MAIDGLKISWSLKPPMSFKWDPPAAMVTSAGNTIVLAPKVQDWLERGIVTDDCSLIPDRVHFGRLFYVPKKGGGIRPILDLSFLNTFIKTPKPRMEAIFHLAFYRTRNVCLFSGCDRCLFECQDA